MPELFVDGQKVDCPGAILRAQVEQLFEERVPFADIEAYIERRGDISEAQRNALWLYAWSRCRI